MVRRYDAVLFDLLTALLDSGSLWNRVAGNPDDGKRWRAAYLRTTYRRRPLSAYQSWSRTRPRRPVCRGGLRTISLRAMPRSSRGPRRPAC